MNKNIDIYLGLNSQGKTFKLEELNKQYKDECIYISNETKANEAIKNSTDSSPLIKWLERLLNINEIQEIIDRQINTIDMSDINEKSNININLKSSMKNYKGLISAEITTDSNQWKKAGSGETFFGELLLIEKMLSSVNNNPIKCLIIDEPETFLHPSLNYSVCSVLKRISKYVKIIVATHSPEFVKNIVDDLSYIIFVQNGIYTRLKSNEIYIDELKKIPLYNNSETLFDSTKKALEMINEYFKIFLMPKIIECLFSKCIIIGEGVAEQILFQCFKDKMKDSNYLSDISFQTLYGKDFIPFFSEILKELNIKSLIIFDEDNDKEKNKEKHIAYNNAIKSNNNTISFSNNLEDEINLEISNNIKKNSIYKSVISPILIENAYIDNNNRLLRIIIKIDVVIKEMLSI